MTYAPLKKNPAQTQTSQAAQKPRQIPGRSPRPLCNATTPEILRGYHIQTKLHIGPSHDALERAADRAADVVMAGAAPSSVASTPAVVGLNRSTRGHFQREPVAPGAGEESGSLGPQFHSAFENTRARGGRRLEPQLRGFMETRFGSDFSDVRVHDNGAAGSLARHISARAFTYGDDIFFGPGEYRPSNRGGARLIAHELSHVVQQGAADSHGRLSRSIGFSKQTAELTHSVYDKGKSSRSPGLFDDMVHGLAQYLCLKPTHSETPKGKQITSTELSKLVLPGLDKLEFLKPLNLPPQVEPAARQLVAVSLAMAVDGIRNKISAFLNGSELTVSEPGFETPMIMLTDNETKIYVKGSLYKTTAVAPKASWGGFWMILHELLHMCDWKLEDAGLGGSAKGYQDVTKSDRAFNWRGGGTGTHKLTETGTADLGVNLVRLAHGLPIRATYMDALVERTAFPVASGTVFRSYEGGAGEDFYGWVASPFPTDDPGMIDSIHSQLNHVPVPDPEEQAARREKQATAVRTQEDLYQQRGLNLLKARAKSLSILEEGQPFYTLFVFSKLSVQGDSVVGKFTTKGSKAASGEVKLHVTPMLGKTTADDESLESLDIRATVTYEGDRRPLEKTFNITGSNFESLEKGWGGEIAPPGAYGLKIQGMARPRSLPRR